MLRDNCLNTSLNESRQVRRLSKLLSVVIEGDCGSKRPWGLNTSVCFHTWVLESIPNMAMGTLNSINACSLHFTYKNPFLLHTHIRRRTFFHRRRRRRLEKCFPFNILSHVYIYIYIYISHVFL